MLAMKQVKNADEAHKEKEELRRVEKQRLFRYISELLKQFMYIYGRHSNHLTPALSRGEGGIQEVISLFSE